MRTFFICTVLFVFLFLCLIWFIRIRGEAMCEDGSLQETAPLRPQTNQEPAPDPTVVESNYFGSRKKWSRKLSCMPCIPVFQYIYTKFYRRKK